MLDLELYQDFFRARDAADRGDPTLAKQYAEEAAQMYERAVSGLLSKCQLLYFAYAHFEEGRNNHEKVHEIYNRLIEIQDVDPTLAYVQYLKFARRAEGIKSARLVFKKAREDERSNHHVYVASALMEYNCSKVLLPIDDRAILFLLFSYFKRAHNQ